MTPDVRVLFGWIVQMIPCDGGTSVELYLSVTEEQAWAGGGLPAAVNERGSCTRGWVCLGVHTCVSTWTGQHVFCIRVCALMIVCDRLLLEHEFPAPLLADCPCWSNAYTDSAEEQMGQSQASGTEAGAGTEAKAERRRQRDFTTCTHTRARARAHTHNAFSTMCARHMCEHPRMLARIAPSINKLSYSSNA